MVLISASSSFITSFLTSQGFGDSLTHMALICGSHVYLSAPIAQNSARCTVETASIEPCLSVQILPRERVMDRLPLSQTFSLPSGSMNTGVVGRGC